MIKVGIIGGTGYTGSVLLSLLVRHPQVELAVITSRSEAGRPLAAVFPHLRGLTSLVFSPADSALLAQCDVVFSATPNGVAMTYAKDLLSAGVKLIDLAADFRLTDSAVWQQWYGMPHTCPDLLSEAVYGLPELNRQQIKQARLIANPGCYPTATALGFAPLLEQGLVDPDSLIADVKSGITGAGRKATVGTLYAETADSFKAYGVDAHRHDPEIQATLQGLTESAVNLVFVPHLAPMLRGIHATLYARLTQSDVDLQAVFEKRYQDEPFVDVLPMGSHPETRTVRGCNSCRIAVHQLKDKNTVIVLAVIDNLVKGAAGQAIQNMNIMFNVDEKVGLDIAAVVP